MKINKIKTSLKIWAIIGIILLLWTIFWHFQNKYYSGAYFITMAIIYTISFSILILYLIISLIILISKFMKNKK